MHKIIKLLLFLSCFISYSQSFADTIIVKGEKSFVIKLPSNPSTGYSWSLVTYDKKLLTSNDSQYHAAKSSLLGAPGETWWTFNINKPSSSKPQKTSIVFKYAQPWSKTGATQKIINVIIQ